MKLWQKNQVESVDTGTHEALDSPGTWSLMKLESVEMETSSYVLCIVFMSFIYLFNTYSNILNSIIP